MRIFLYYLSLFLLKYTYRLYMKKFFEKINNRSPLTIGSFIILLLIIYLITVVGKTILDNYHSNKGISNQEQKLVDLEYELEYLENEIVYFSSQSFKEKQARAKLGYILPGEKIISVPKDPPVKSDEVLGADDESKNPHAVSNYLRWYEYYFE